MSYEQAGSGWSRFLLSVFNRGTRMNRIDRVLTFLEIASVKYYARAVEGSIALTLIGLALYISDERVIAYKLVLAPKGVPIHTAAFILVAAGIAQIIGVTMPLIHDLFRHYGFRNRWLAQVWLNEKTWRISAMVVAIILWGAYAGLMSAISGSAWLLAGSNSVLLTISIFRLEAMMDADRDKPSRNEPLPDDAIRGADSLGSCSDNTRLEILQPPQSRPALGLHGNIPN